MPETMSRGANVACNDRVLCRNCSRVADGVLTARRNGWLGVGIKEPGSYYWATCWKCLGKSAPGIDTGATVGVQS